MAKQIQSKLVTIKALITLIKDKIFISLATSLSLSSPTNKCLSDPRLTASSTISSLEARLKTTSSCHVALKCLLVIRHVMAHGSCILRDQICFFKFPNLSSFRDNTGSEAWELSNWVRFYSRYLEGNVISYRVLGFFVSSPKYGSQSTNLSNLSNWELIRETEVLVGLIEEICKAPGSCSDSKENFVYEISGLISEDYGSVQRLLVSRLSEFRDRVTKLTLSELGEINKLMRRVERCRGRVFELFRNRKRNDAFWEFLIETRIEMTRFMGRVGEQGRAMVIFIPSSRIRVTRPADPM